IVGGIPTSKWINLGNPDGTAIQTIVANPTRRTDDIYVVTLKGVYYLPHSGAPWVAPGTAGTFANITGNLFVATGTPVPTRSLFGDPTQQITTLQYLTSLAVDWRFASAPGATPVTPPILYVGGEGGIFRSDDRGTT